MSAGSVVDAWDVPGLPLSGERGQGTALQSLLTMEDREKITLLVEWIETIRPQAIQLGPTLSVLTGIPEGELLASPFAFRTVLMGVSSGVSGVHEEARSQCPWRSHLRSEDPSLHGTSEIWAAGRLQVDKYASFCQDGPFVSFHPEHSAKWTPHEMLHRALGFFYRPDMSRWELYMGARLNEALPVGFWYGLDRVARLTEDPSGPPVIPGEHGASRENALWLTEDRESLVARVTASVQYLTSGLKWALDELSAVQEECREGVTVPLPGGFLDGSSDAMAYVVAHWNRLTDPVIANVLKKHTSVDVHRFETISAYIEHWKGTLWELLFGRLEGSIELAEAQRAVRASWDAALWDAMSDQASLTEEGEEGSLYLGQLWSHDVEQQVDWEQIVDGLERVLPATVHGLSEGDPDAQVLAHFVDAGYFSSRAPIHERFSRALADFDAPFLLELAQFEGLLAHGLERSDQAERLGMTPPSQPEFEEGILIHHPGFRMESFSPDMLQYHSEVLGAEPMQWGSGVFLMGRLGEDVMMLPAPPPIAGIWLHLRAEPRECKRVMKTLSDLLEGTEFPEEWPHGAAEWIREMVAAGACVWTPLWEGRGVDVVEPTE